MYLDTVKQQASEINKLEQELGISLPKACKVGIDYIFPMTASTNKSASNRTTSVQGKPVSS
ncbi:hypothetical protein [Coleofasciculus sp.]|uniref:hypothetical protein n=1 Tax=Coleofasciculus sp. TaxID=3100458 RepID=UPI0039FA9F7E